MGDYPETRYVMLTMPGQHSNCTLQGHPSALQWCNPAEGSYRLPARLRLGNGRGQKGGIEPRAIAQSSLEDGDRDIGALGRLLQMQPVGSEPAHMAA